MNRKRLFLLGGHDLEMEKIAELLKQHGESFLDRGLSWGAKLSDYADALGFDGEIVGIELFEDIDPPANYRSIDHHGSRWCEATSLEQVASMLNVSLDRYQQLVAANDRGHIRALKAMGASNADIEMIRRADRQAQGVTPDEEAQAEREALLEHPVRHGVHIVKTDLKHVSALADRLLMQGKEPLLLYGEQGLSFYSDTIAPLLEHFVSALAEGSAYYGGNPPGFFGLTSKYLAHHGIDETVETIVELAKRKKDRMYSFHRLMFAFRLSDAGNVTAKRWRPRRLPADDTLASVAQAYNQFTYFYPYVQKLLFGNAHAANTSACKTFERYGSQGTLRVKARGRTFTLHIDEIVLHVFGDDIGILSLALENEEMLPLDKLLLLNDTVRRLYPQFLGGNLVADTKQAAMLPCEITLELDGMPAVTENFEAYGDRDTIAKHLATGSFRLPAHLKTLFDELYGDVRTLTPLIDDRMFLLCHVMDDAFSRELTRYDEGRERYAYETSADWYRYVYADTDLMCQNPRMLQDFIRTATYARWADYGTLFGISRYTFMALSNNNEFSKHILNTHMHTVYTQMALLLLAYRAMILKFSDDVTNILNDNEKAKRSEALFKAYLAFRNNIYFKEVTAQEQGIELFELARKQMQLDERLDELDHDIAELHDFLSMRIDKERNENAHRLNRLAAFFLPAATVSGILGMNFFPQTWTDYAAKHADAVIVIAALIAALTGIVFYLTKKEPHE